MIQKIVYPKVQLHALNPKTRTFKGVPNAVIKSAVGIDRK